MLLLLILGALVPITAPSGTQEPAVSITPRVREYIAGPPLRANLRIDASMVLVPVTVTDATDHPISNLVAESFRVFEDNVEQKIVSFYREDGPVSIGFIFDASSSMKGRVDRSVAAVQQFLATLEKGDEYFLVRFSDRASLLTGFTDQSQAILSSLKSVEPHGWTALNDAICLGLQEMKRAKNPRRALIILTDGGDNNSRYTDSEVRNLAREADVRIYSIGVFERPRFLEKLAMDTGGRAIWAHKLQDLPGVVDKLSRALRNQYVLGYVPAVRQHDGKYHTIRVEMAKPIKLRPLNVSWRRGYYAPEK